MSFKRDGDDLSLLNKLKHRRVSDMLGSYIPEDEAKLLSNGRHAGSSGVFIIGWLLRLACLICNHRPVFDTMQMLAKHRQGKRHLYQLNKFLLKNEELEYLRQKREQENYVKYIENTITSEIVANSQLLGPKNNSGSNKFLPSIRRKVLDVPESNRSLTVSTSTKKSEVSGSSHLRKYLRNLKKKPNLETFVENQIKMCNVLPSESGTKEETSVNRKETFPVPVNNSTLNQGLQKTTDDLSLGLSGYIKDKHGNWVKDPNAEFDTDDDNDDITTQ